MDFSACPSLARGHVTTTWYRAVPPSAIATALSTSHTPRVKSRFSPGSVEVPAFELLYLAENQLIAMFEAEALYGNPMKPGGVVGNPLPLTVVPISVVLSDVADITEPSQARLLQTNARNSRGLAKLFRPGNRDGRFASLRLCSDPTAWHDPVQLRFQRTDQLLSPAARL